MIGSTGRGSGSCVLAFSLAPVAFLVSFAGDKIGVSRAASFWLACVVEVAPNALRVLVAGIKIVVLVARIQCSIDSTPSHRFVPIALREVVASIGVVSLAGLPRISIRDTGSSNPVTTGVFLALRKVFSVITHPVGTTVHVDTPPAARGAHPLAAVESSAARVGMPRALGCGWPPSSLLRQVGKSS